MCAPWSCARKYYDVILTVKPSMPKTSTVCHRDMVSSTRARVPYAAFARELMRLCARPQTRMNQTELAAAAGVSPGYVSRLMQGRQRPGMDVLESLASALNTDVDPLARLVGYSTPTDDENRPHLPGWESLNEEQRTVIRQTVAAFVQGNVPRPAPASRPVGRPRRQVNVRGSRGSDQQQPHHHPSAPEDPEAAQP